MCPVSTPSSFNPPEPFYFQLMSSSVYETQQGTNNCLKHSQLRGIRIACSPPLGSYRSSLPIFSPHPRIKLMPQIIESCARKPKTSSREGARIARKRWVIQPLSPLEKVTRHYQIWQLEQWTDTGAHTVKLPVSEIPGQPKVRSCSTMLRSDDNHLKTRPLLHVHQTNEKKPRSPQYSDIYSRSRCLSIATNNELIRNLRFEFSYPRRIVTTLSCSISLGTLNSL